MVSLSVAFSYPTLAAVPHMFTNAHKNVLSAAVAAEYYFPQAEQSEGILEGPDKSTET